MFSTAAKDMCDITDVEACGFYVDVQPLRRAVSISSVDSEPIVRARKQSCSSINDTSSCDSDHGETFFQQGSLALTDMPDIDILSTIKEINSVDKRFTSEAHMAKVLFSHKKYKGIVTAESAENNLVFESGTNVFLSDGTAVGVIQTLFGPLERPLYIVRGEEEHIERLTSSHQLCADVHLHTDVRQQIVMHSTEMYLNKSHATDASYVNDEELPEYVRPDFSDDEKEMLWKRERKQQRHNIHDSSVSSEDECVHNDIDWSTIKWDMEN